MTAEGTGAQPHRSRERPGRLDLRPPKDPTRHLDLGFLASRPAREQHAVPPCSSDTGVQSPTPGPPPGTAARPCPPWGRESGGRDSGDLQVKVAPQAARPARGLMVWEGPLAVQTWATRTPAFLRDGHAQGSRSPSIVTAPVQVGKLRPGEREDVARGYRLGEAASPVL